MLLMISWHFYEFKHTVQIPQQLAAQYFNTDGQINRKVSFFNEEVYNNGVKRLDVCNRPKQGKNSLEKLCFKTTEVFLVSELVDSELTEQKLLFPDLRNPKKL